jgi:hypothetical protein
MKRVLLRVICVVVAMVATAHIGTISAGDIKFQGYGNLGMVYSPSVRGAGPTADVSVGVQLGDHFYAGFETGFHTAIYPVEFLGEELTMYDSYIPLAVNIKRQFGHRMVRPFFNISLGGFIGAIDLESYNGFFCQAGAGVEINRISVGLGYSGLVKSGTESSLYLKVGFRFGGYSY